MEVFKIIFGIAVATILVWFAIDSIKVIVAKIRKKKSKKIQRNDNDVIERTENDKN